MTGLLAVLNLCVAGALFTALAPPYAVLTLGFFFLGFGLSWVASGPPALAVAVGAAFVAAAAFRTPHSDGHRRRLIPLSYVPLAFGIASFILAPLSRFPDPFDAGALLTMGIVVILVGKRLSPNVVASAAFIATGAWLMLSLGAIVAHLPDATEQGRARGLMENANGLGPIAVLFACLSLTRSRATQLLAFATAAVTIVLTESRASMAALLVALLVAIWGTHFTTSPSAWATTRRCLLTAALAVTSLQLLRSGAIADQTAEGLLRQGDSGRTALALSAWEQFQQNQLTGLGLGAVNQPEYATSLVLPIHWASILGFAGLILVAATIALMLGALRHPESVTRTLLATALIYVLAEPWLIAAGSITSWVFWCVVASSTATTIQSRSPEHTEAIPSYTAALPRKPYPAER